MDYARQVRTFRKLKKKAGEEEEDEEEDKFKDSAFQISKNYVDVEKDADRIQRISGFG